MSLSASADNPTFGHREIRNGAPIPPPIDDEDEKPSRHKRIGRKGLTAAIAAAVVFVALGGAAAGGMSDDLPRELWSWLRATLITVIVIGLVVAGFGYGVEGANRREERTRAEMEMLAAVLDRKLQAVSGKVDDHGHNVLVDHTALHRDALKNQEEIGLVFEALSRVLAYEEQRAHQMALLREQMAEMHAIMAQTNLALATDQLEKIALEAARQMFRDVYTAVQDAARKRGGEARWTPGDAAWLEDVAEAFELGRTMGPELGPEPR